jgi:hypothetical protein
LQFSPLFSTVPTWKSSFFINAMFQVTELWNMTFFVIEFIFDHPLLVITNNSVALVRERTIPSKVTVYVRKTYTNAMQTGGKRENVLGCRHTDNIRWPQITSLCIKSQKQFSALEQSDNRPSSHIRWWPWNEQHLIYSIVVFFIRFWFFQK